MAIEKMRAEYLGQLKEPMSNNPMINVAVSEGDDLDMPNETPISQNELSYFNETVRNQRPHKGRYHQSQEEFDEVNLNNDTDEEDFNGTFRVPD